MSLNLLALFLLAKLASCEIEDATSLTQRPENDRYRSSRFLYVPTKFDEYEEENLEESLVNTQKYENEDETSPQWPEDNNYMLPKFLEVPTALDDYEFYEYEYSGDYEDFEDESLEEFSANLEKNKSWIERNMYTVLILANCCCWCRNGCNGGSHGFGYFDEWRGCHSPNRLGCRWCCNGCYGPHRFGHFDGCHG